MLAKEQNLKVGFSLPISGLKKTQTTPSCSLLPPPPPPNKPKRKTKPHNKNLKTQNRKKTPTPTSPENILQTNKPSSQCKTSSR